MLVLTRRLEQSIVINGDIVISVLAIDGDRVKLGISAPANVSILREEVQHAVRGENQRAAGQAKDRAGLEAALRSIRREAAPSPDSPVGKEAPESKKRSPDPL
jgi:carbon storage regulator